MKKSFIVLVIALCVIGVMACKQEPAHEHTWNEGEITTKATCTTDGVMTYTCTGCGETRTEVIPATGHSYEIGWSHDDTYHWHAATCEHTELYTDKAVHNWGLEGEITTPATHTQTGVRTYTCLNCGAKKTESIPADASAHEFSTTWTTDANYHWHVATCGHEVIGDSAAHTFGDVKVTKAATCTASGTGTQTCTVCGYVKNVTIPALGHDMVDHVCTRCGLFEPFIGETGGYVFYDCDADNAFGNADGLVSCDCGWRYLEAAPEDLEVESSFYHSFGYYRESDAASNQKVGTSNNLGKGKENTEALVAAMGSEVYKKDSGSEKISNYAAKLCDDYSAGGKDDWFLPSKDELNLMYTNLKLADLGGFQDDSYLSSSEYNEYLVWGQFFLNGNQGDYSRNNTPRIRPVRAYGAPEGEHVHTFSSAWTYSPSAHWHAATCGHTDQKADSAKHTYDDGVVTVEPTCTTQGTKIFTCTVCGYSYSQYPPMAALGHDLTPVEGVAATCTTPGTKAHNHCSRCGKDFNDLGLELTNLIIPAGHTWDEGTPDGAGNIDFECTVCHATKKAPIPSYSIGDTGSAGGFIFYDCDADNDETNGGAGPDGLKSDVCGWRYMEIWRTDLSNVAYSMSYSTKDKTDDDSYAYDEGKKKNYLILDELVTGAAIGDGKANTEAFLEAAKNGYLYSDIAKYATKLDTAKCPFYVASESDAGGKTDWFIPSVGELAAAQNAGFTFINAGYGVWSSTHEASDVYYTRTMKSGVSSTSNQGPNSRWYMVRRFIVD